METLIESGIDRWRIGNGRERIKLGVKFYSNAMDDEA